MNSEARLVCTNFRVKIAWPDYERLCVEVAEQIAAIPGLIWKAWVVNETRQEGGGIYLFDSEETAANFLQGPIIAHLENHPAFEDVRIKSLSLLAEPSRLTYFDAIQPKLSRP